LNKDKGILSRLFKEKRRLRPVAGLILSMSGARGVVVKTKPP